MSAMAGQEIISSFQGSWTQYELRAKGLCTVVLR